MVIGELGVLAWALNISLVVVSLSFILAFVRLVAGPTLPDRVIALDLIAFLVIIAESFGSLALVAGFLTRFSAASLAVIMRGAITMVHLPYGCFMNWFGQQQGEGYEYHGLIHRDCGRVAGNRRRSMVG